RNFGGRPAGGSTDRRERLSRLGQDQRSGRHPPPKERRRLLARRGNGGTVGVGRDRARARDLAAAAGRERPGRPCGAGGPARAAGIPVSRGEARPAPGRRPARRMVVELDPGEGSEPYHYVYGREEWLLVL